MRIQSNSVARFSPALAKPLAAVQPAVARVSVDHSLTRQSLALAIGSLIIAGCFSLLLVIGRLPIFSHWISDPLFFKRCLVLHVDLALIVWFFAFAAGLYSLLPGNRSSNRQFRAGLWIAVAGCAAMVIGTLIPGTQPVLANYVPVIDNIAYVSGVAMFFGGLLLSFISDRLFISAPNTPRSALSIQPDAAIGLKACAIAYLAAITTFLVSCAATPRDLEVRVYYELIFWGGGHILQVANVAAMLAVWLHLLSSILERPVLKSAAARVLFALLVLPHMIGPLLTANGTIGGLYRQGFTRLMQFGIAPVVLIILGLCVREIRRGWRSGLITRSDLFSPPFIGFALSASLTIVGFILGSSIRNSNTMIPAHYHVSIGAVTVAFMAITFLLLPALGFAFPNARIRRLIPWQLTFFGAGQVVFAIGFAIGGVFGLSRKAYAVEQQVRGAGELIGLGVMGLGGLIAVIGGLMFLFLVASSAWERLAAPFRKSKLPLIQTSNP